MKLSSKSSQFRLFAIGLGIILISITAIQFVQQHVISNAVDPNLINIAGRQLMISQRITKQCFYLEYNIYPEGLNIKDSLKKYSDLLELTHIELIEKNRVKVKDNEIANLLNRAIPFMESLTGASRILLADSEVNADSIFRAIAHAELNYLPIMGQVTSSFERRSVQDLRFIRRLDLLLTLILVLIITGLFVVLYFPILKELELKNQEMKSINEGLELARKKISEEQILLRTIIDNIPINIYVKDKHSRKILANRHEWEYLGAHNEAEVIGKSDHDIYPSKSAVISNAEDQKVFSGKSIIARETFNFKKDGTEKWFLISKVPLRNDTGEIVGLVGVSIDITERKNANLELEKLLERLTQLNNEKNQFMSMATHDLKNPLNSIAGLTSLLRMEKKLDPGADEIVAMIESTILKMKELISRLLDYNKIERGEAKVNLTKVDLNKLISDRLQSYKEPASKKSINLTFNQLLQNPMIETDPALLEQILDNLISNALKFSNQGTEIVIRLTELGNYKVIIVQDQGPGIKEDELHKLFLPFTKLSSRPTAGESSSGLGMSIVKELVQMLGGNIKVDSKVGLGTTVSVALRVT